MSCACSVCRKAAERGENTLNDACWLAWLSGMIAYQRPAETLKIQRKPLPSEEKS
jgi:hypothetical protein